MNVAPKSAVTVHNAKNSEDIVVNKSQNSFTKRSIKGLCIFTYTRGDGISAPDASIPGDYQIEIQPTKLVFNLGKQDVRGIQAQSVAKALLEQYKKSEDPDIADQMTETLDASVGGANMNITQSSWNS